MAPCDKQNGSSRIVEQFPQARRPRGGDTVVQLLPLPPRAAQHRVHWAATARWKSREGEWIAATDKVIRFRTWEITSRRITTPFPLGPAKQSQLTPSYFPKHLSYNPR